MYRGQERVRREQNKTHCLKRPLEALERFVAVVAGGLFDASRLSALGLVCTAHVADELLVLFLVFNGQPDGPRVAVPPQVIV